MAIRVSEQIWALHSESAGAHNRGLLEKGSGQAQELSVLRSMGAGMMPTESSMCSCFHELHDEAQRRQQNMGPVELPGPDEIREVGSGLSLADTSTGRYVRLYSRRRLCARRSS